MKSKFKDFIGRVFVTIQRPEMSILPGQLAFFFVLSIVPLIALIGSIAVFFSVGSTDITNFMNDVLPQGISDVLAPVLTGKSASINTWVFYLSAFILASNGTHSMIIASNTLYKFKNKNYISRRIKAVIMTIILVSLLLFVIVVPAFGDIIINTICSYINNSAVETNIAIIYNILKYPLTLLLIYFNIKLLYVMAPDSTILSKNTTYGSVVTTIGWTIATEIYSIYVSSFSRYNLFYGSISNILILLLWFYILAYIFVLGMALNVEYYDNK